ncbi:MAG: amino acid--tRNA ligase-related protein [Candidatus Woesearchaeota archaeon]
MINIKENVKINSSLLEGIRKFLEEQNFLEINTPKISFLPTDQDDHLFTVDYFGTTTYLIQTPQFFKQAYVINGVDSVFEIGPVFRAEPRVTKRHLSEFVCLDIESSTFSHLDEIIKFEKKLLLAASTYLSNKDLPISPIESFEVVTYKEIKRILGLADNEPIGNSHESTINEYFKKDGIFITEYPADERIFYYEEENGISQSFDLILKGIEITSGGLRKTSKKGIIEGMKKNNIDCDRYTPYLDLFTDEVPVHGGFGIGIERLLSKFISVEDVSQVLPYLKKPNTQIGDLRWK